MMFPRAGLYALTPDDLDDRALEDKVRAVVDGGAVMVQYRQKGVAPDSAHARGCALRSLCHGVGVPLIVNDDCALAIAIGAAGVHLGREDVAVAEARRLLGPDAIIGASCYDSLDRARAAAAAGASYVAFGSVFASPTKPGASQVPLAVIAQASRELALPICAIGGISVANAPAVVAAGASLLAVISDVFGAADPCAAAQRYRLLFAPAA
ncbi:MAG TPA: thiamine phosphate synthase [Xanthomonadaceae bacterium]|nr:thiamine phosphate synthase [Xanthomonadaceae bacterium]